MISYGLCISYPFYAVLNTKNDEIACLKKNYKESEPWAVLLDEKKGSTRRVRRIEREGGRGPDKSSRRRT